MGPMTGSDRQILTIVFAGLLSAFSPASLDAAARADARSHMGDATSRTSSVGCPKARPLTSTLKMNDGKTFSVEAKIFDLNLCAKVLHGDFWGATDIQPKTFIGQMSMRMGTDDIEVPLSAFADLGDPSEISSKMDKAGILVELQGSGVSKWIADIWIRDGAIVRRRVWNADFPNDAFQTTEYHYVDN
jgi:hypothetical protein